ncbi:MAG: hypothetical protein ABFD50_13085 [Smithella sp.]
MALFIWAKQSKYFLTGSRKGNRVGIKQNFFSMKTFKLEITVERTGGNIDVESTMQGELNKENVAEVAELLKSILTAEEDNETSYSATIVINDGNEKSSVISVANVKKSLILEVVSLVNGEQADVKIGQEESTTTHVVTEQDVEENPELSELGITTGEEINIPTEEKPSTSQTMEQGIPEPENLSGPLSA